MPSISARHPLLVWTLTLLMSCWVPVTLMAGLPDYKTQIACEGNSLQLSCDEGTKINLIRANFGRFSISICNTQGNLDWSVNCMSRRSFRVMQEVCGNQSACLLHANANYFGDPCPGVHKYLEVHYQCLPPPVPSVATPAVRTLPSLPAASVPGSSVKPTVTSRTRNGNNNKQQGAAPSSSSRKPSSAAPSSPSSTTNKHHHGHGVSDTITGSGPSSSNITFPTMTTTSTSSTTGSTPVLDGDVPSGPESQATGGHHRPRMPFSSVSSSEQQASSILSPVSSSSSDTDPLESDLLSGPSGSHNDVDTDSMHPDYESPSSASPTLRSSLPLSEPLRVLITVGCVFGMVTLSVTLLAISCSLPSSKRITRDQGPTTSPLRIVSSSVTLTALTTATSATASSSLSTTGMSPSSCCASCASTSSGSSCCWWSRCLHQERQVKQHLMFCLVCVQSCFLWGISVDESFVGTGSTCSMVSMMLHFFFLSTFVWLFMDGFTLYLSLLHKGNDNDLSSHHHQHHPQHSLYGGSAMSTSSSSMSRWRHRLPSTYVLVSYGVPLFVHVLSIILDYGSPSTASMGMSIPLTSSTHCWLRSDKYFVLTFVGPLIAVLSGNFLFLAITVVCCNYGSLLRNKESGVSSGSIGRQLLLRARVRRSLAIFVALSLALTALFVSLCQELPEDEGVFSMSLYTFGLLNPIQVLVLILMLSGKSPSYGASSGSSPSPSCPMVGDTSQRSKSVKVLSSLGFLHDHSMPKGQDTLTQQQQAIHQAQQHQQQHQGSYGGIVHQQQQQGPDPIIPLPHASTLNLSALNQGSGDGSSKTYGTQSDYGFRGLNYRSPVYGTQANTMVTTGRITGVQQAGGTNNLNRGVNHIHSKQCLQVPSSCPVPHVVEHVYESIDEDPYIARLLMPSLPTPLMAGRKHQMTGNQGNQPLPAIIRDNTNHSTIICSSSLNRGVLVASSTLHRGQGQQGQQQQQLQSQHHHSTPEQTTPSPTAQQLMMQQQQALRQESTLI